MEGDFYASVSVSKSTKSDKFKLHAVQCEIFFVGVEFSPTSIGPQVLTLNFNLAPPTSFSTSQETPLGHKSVELYSN